MNKRPPREGARWGEDPAPEQPAPPPQPQVPQLFVELNKRFGQENVTNAIAIQILVKREFPHLKVNQLDKLVFASEILEYTQKWVKFAASDGRVHPMSEALQLLSKQVGGILGDDPDHLLQSKYMIYFDDEHTGHAARKAIAERDKSAREKDVMKMVGTFALIIFGPALLFGYIAGEKPGGYSFGEAFLFWAGVIGAVLAFTVLVEFLTRR